MAALNKGKHIVEEIDGIRCTIVEKGLSLERLNFLKDILETNKYLVKVRADNENTYTIGVTDIVFNPIIAIYDCSLKTTKGAVITPEYWNQWTTKNGGRYWMYKK